jgi:hypothetical protein
MTRHGWWSLGTGAAAGALSAAATMVHFGEVGAPRVFGFCLGLAVGDDCNGMDLAFYVFPGFVFGALFAALQAALGRIAPVGALAFALASGVANAAAVFICVAVFNIVGNLVDLGILELPLALGGAVAGAAGSALLGAAALILAPGSRFGRPVAAGAALGLLTPLMTEFAAAGAFLFYIAWQGGYGLALASSLPDRV